jgi:hypothetical protein
MRDHSHFLQLTRIPVHDPDYRASLQDFTTFLDFLTQKVIEVDETIPELPVKDIVRFQTAHRRNIQSLTLLQIFRIYRDIRFSSDPTPYKVSAYLLAKHVLVWHSWQQS